METRNKTAENVANFISKRIVGATLTRHINNTLTFTLPYSQKKLFEEFFMALERNKNSLDIASYGISDTTLEEVQLEKLTNIRV
jgi:ATP-binding cassette subfamily A (ABC1) protein 2